MVKRMILAYDGSDHSKKALEWAIGLAKQADAEILIVGVYERLLYHMEAPMQTADLEEIYLQGFRSVLRDAMIYCRNQGVAARMQLENGHPSDTIIKIAKETATDLIVCGTRGHGGVSRLLLGSVAHKLVTYSTVPVFVVK